MKRKQITVESKKSEVAAFTVEVNEYESVQEAVEKLTADVVLTFINEREVIRKGDRARQLAAKGHKVEEIQQVLDGELKLRRTAVALTPERIIEMLSKMPEDQRAAILSKLPVQQ